MTDPAQDPQRLKAWYENNALNERKQWNELTTRLYREIDTLNGIIDSLKDENTRLKDEIEHLPARLEYKQGKFNELKDENARRVAL